MEKTEFKQDEFFQELKRIRESKGLRLEDISRACRIRLYFLEQIENGSFNNLPEPFYTKTFIKTYAARIEVNADPILKRYEKYIERTMPAPPPEAAREQVRELHTEQTIPDWLKGRERRIGWACLTLAVVIILGIYVCRNDGGKPVETKTIAQEAAKLPEKPAGMPSAGAPQAHPVPKPEAAPVKTPVPEQKKDTLAPSTLAAGPFNLTIEATEAAWVQVKADKSPTTQKLMQAGEKLSTEAKEKITVDIGNAGGVQITFQGQSMGSPGKRGEKVRLVYPEGKRIEKKKSTEQGPVTKPDTE